MFLLWLLIIANLVGGFIAASTYIVARIPDLEGLSNFLNKFKLPIGITVFIISFFNIFNFWSDHYPKLTLLFGLATGFILSVDIFNTFEIPAETKEMIVKFANRFAIISGIGSVIIALIWILQLLLDAFKFIL